MRSRLMTLTVLAGMLTVGAVATAQEGSAEAVFQKLLAAAQDNDRERAMALIEELKALDDAVPFLSDRLNSGDEREMGLAMMALEGMTDKAEQVAPIMFELTKHADERLRGAATMALINFDRSEKTVDRLIELLQDESSVVRWKAGYCFKEIGPDANKAVPALVKAIDDEDRDVRSYAVVALGAIHSQPDVSVPALVHALDVSTMDAAVALRQFGSDAAPAVPALVKWLNDGEKTGTNLAAREIAATLAVTSSPQAKVPRFRADVSGGSTLGTGRPPAEDLDPVGGIPALVVEVQERGIRSVGAEVRSGHTWAKGAGRGASRPHERPG